MRLQIPRNATLLTPIPIGMRADGQIAHEVVCTPTGGVNKLVSGMTGAGKSWGEAPVLITCAALQADILLLDPVKGIQSYQDIAGCFQMYEIDPGRIRKILNRLLSHVLPARTNHLAREGLKQWVPGKSSLRYLIVHVEEGWRVASNDALVGLGAAIRSAGGRLVDSLQQPTFEHISTTLRNQMGAYRAYGLADRDYNEYSLPENVIAAGANPAQWGNEDPGMHYCVMPGMDIRTKVMPVRAWDDGTGDNTFAAAAAKVGANLGAMDPVTAAALGDLWDSHIPPLELVKQMGAIVPGPATQAALTTVPAPVVTLPPPTPALDEDGDIDPDELRALLEGLGVDPDEAADMDLEDEPIVIHQEDGSITVTDDAGEFAIDVDPDAQDDEDWADPDAPMHPVVARMIGDPPKDGVTPEEFAQLVDMLVTEFVASDRDALYRGDFINIAGDCGWSPASFYKRLDRDPRIIKADRGWIRVADAPTSGDEDDQDDEDAA